MLLTQQAFNVILIIGAGLLLVLGIFIKQFLFDEEVYMIDLFICKKDNTGIHKQQIDNELTETQLRKLSEHLDAQNMWIEDKHGKKMTF